MLPAAGSPRFVAIAALLAAAAVRLAAQAPSAALAHLPLYPDPDTPRNCTVFSSRSDNVTVAGEILQGGPGEHQVGVGDHGKGRAEIAGFRATIQDQNAATAESYHVVIRRAAGNGEPDASSTGVIYQSGGLATPPGSGLQSWLVTHVFAAAVVVPLTGRWFYGILLPAAPLWPSDGMSAWFAHDTLGSLGDNPRQGAPTTNFDVRGGQTHRPQERGTFAMGVLMVAAVLLLAAINPFNTRQTPRGAPNYGRGGLFPDVDGHLGSGRRDDLGLRVVAPAAGGGFAVIALAAVLATSPLCLNGWQGCFRLDPTAVLFLPVATLDAAGSVLHTFSLGAANSPLRRQLARRTLWAQAIWFTAALTVVGFTNAAAWQTRA